MHGFPSGAFLLPAIEGYCSIKFESEAPRDSNPLGGSYPIYRQYPCGLRIRTANRATERRNRTVFTFHRASEISQGGITDFTMFSCIMRMMQRSIVPLVTCSGWAGSNRRHPLSIGALYH